MNPLQYRRKTHPDGTPFPSMWQKDHTRKKRAGSFVYEENAHGFYTTTDGNRYARYWWGDAWIPYDTIIRFMCVEGNPVVEKETDEWVSEQSFDVMNIATVPVKLLIADVWARTRAKKKRKRDGIKQDPNRPRRLKHRKLRYPWHGDGNRTTFTPQVINFARAGRLRHPGIARGYVETDSGHRYAQYSFGNLWIPYDTVIRFLDFDGLPIFPEQTAEWITRQQTDVMQLAPLGALKTSSCQGETRYRINDEDSEDNSPPTPTPKVATMPSISTQTETSAMKTPPNTQPKSDKPPKTERKSRTRSRNLSRESRTYSPAEKKQRGQTPKSSHLRGKLLYENTAKGYRYGDDGHWYVKMPWGEIRVPPDVGLRLMRIEGRPYDKKQNHAWARTKYGGIINVGPAYVTHNEDGSMHLVFEYTKNLVVQVNSKEFTDPPPDSFSETEPPNNELPPGKRR